MPEELLKRTGRRGKYGEEAKANLTLNTETNSWEVFASKKPKKSPVPLQYSEVLREGNITDVKRKRKELNADLLTYKRALVSEVMDTEKLTIGVDENGREIPNETERAFKYRKHKQELSAYRRVNYQIEGYTRSRRKPKDFTFSPEEQGDLEKARKPYLEIVPLDNRKEELSKDIDESDRKVYDALRGARNQHRVAIAINNEFVDLRDIQQITNGGLRLPADKSITEWNNEHKAKIEKIRKKIDKGEKLSQKEIDFYDGREGKLKRQRVIGYAIPTTIIKPNQSGKIAVSVSLEKNLGTIKIERSRKKVYVYRNGVQYVGYKDENGHVKLASYTDKEGHRQIRMPQNRIYFYREGTDLIVGYKDIYGIAHNTNIEVLLNNAQKKTGLREIYINNTQFSEFSFFKGEDGRWRLQPFAEPELNAPENEGIIIARYSDTYKQEFAILSETERKLGSIKAPPKLYSQAKSIATIQGSDSTFTGTVMLNYYSAQSKTAIRYLKQAGVGYSVIATDFTITKNGNELVINFDKVEMASNHSKENFYGFVFPNTGGEENATKFQSYDKFMQIGLQGDKLIVVMKSPEVLWSGLVPAPEGKTP